jgi:hypothetical protein
MDPALRSEINKTGQLIVKSIRVASEGRDSGIPRGFTPQRPGRDLVLSDKEIELQTFPLYKDNEVIGVEFFHQQKRHVLDGEGFKALHRIVESLSRLPLYHLRISGATIRVSVIDWVKLKYRKQTRRSMVGFVLEETSKCLHHYQVCIPIQNLSVEIPVKVGPAFLIPLTEDWFDRIEMQLQRNLYITPEQVTAFVNRYRDQFQGYSVAVIKVFGDSQIANLLASIRTRRALDCLLFFSETIIDPSKTTLIEVSNLTPTPATCSFLFSEGKLASSNERLVRGNRVGWVIPKDVCEDLEKRIPEVSSFIFRDSGSEFEEEVREAYDWYIHIPRAEKPYQKLVYALMAIESVLLKDDEEKVGKVWPRFGSILASTQVEYDDFVSLGRQIYTRRHKCLRMIPL